ncbi:MAG: DUF3791 domain-containing protein [Planctomycetaceae bacterium]|jgi:hypothetical protein|nr:DUF3791 domain-containing protein [Planctomycetaceae bacterium]
MNTDKRDENLLVVVAVEEYARRHQMPAAAVLQLFDKHGVLPLIRRNYGTLHTQDLYETVTFAEDVVQRNTLQSTSG